MLSWIVLIVLMGLFGVVFFCHFLLVSSVVASRYPLWTIR